MGDYGWPFDRDDEYVDTVDSGLGYDNGDFVATLREMLGQPAGEDLVYGPRDQAVVRYWHIAHGHDTTERVDRDDWELMASEVDAPVIASPNETDVVTDLEAESEVISRGRTPNEYRAADQEDLRAECDALGLDTSGGQEELAERLIQYRDTPDQG